VPADLLLTTSVHDAVAGLRAGGLVGLPTETVYGLAADAEDPRAMARIYAVKGRPADHPLIVHVADAAALEPGPRSWARDVPGYAHRLAEAVWPGPLTLVLPRSVRAGDQVTGGQDTVGLRSPAHPLALAVIEGFGRAVGRPGAGLAAPSANRFGRVSPTTARHVLDELAGLLLPGLDRVLDGGDCTVGVESTIVDCTGPAPRLLRPGAIGTQVIEQLGGVAVQEARHRDGRPAPGPRAPGTLAAHYAPVAEVVLAVDARQVASLVASTPRDRSAGAPVVGLIAPAGVATPPGVVRLTAPDGAAAYARALYGALREADVLGLRRVVAVPPTYPDGPAAGPDRDAAQPALVAAVIDRLVRAAAGSQPALDVDTVRRSR
jgi:L-threonylcarbamoyladenylate synthase